MPSSYCLEIVEIPFIRWWLGGGLWHWVYRSSGDLQVLNLIWKGWNANLYSQNIITWQHVYSNPRSQISFCKLTCSDISAWLDSYGDWDDVKSFGPQNDIKNAHTYTQIHQTWEIRHLPTYLCELCQEETYLSLSLSMMFRHVWNLTHLTPHLILRSASSHTEAT